MTQPAGLGTSPTLSEAWVRDPLSEVTRKTRLYLLAVSLIGIAMARTGLVPTKVATFGIELEQPNRNALLFLVALVAIYFLVAFLVYAASDFLYWRAQIAAARKRDETALRFEVAGSKLGLGAEATRRRYEDGVLRSYITHEAGGGADLEKEVMAILEGPDVDLPYRETVRPIEGMTGFLRVFFEFVLPILVGLFGIYSLLDRTLTL